MQYKVVLRTLSFVLLGVIASVELSRWAPLCAAACFVHKAMAGDGHGGGGLAGLGGLAGGLGGPRQPLRSTAAGDSRLRLLRERYFALAEASLTGRTSESVGRCNGGEGGCALSSVAPFDAHKRRVGDDWPPGGLTMIGTLRMRNIRMAVEMALLDRVPGDYVELGVWRGGSCIFAKLLLDELDPSGGRKVVLLDAFESMAGYGGLAGFLTVSEREVRRNFEAFGIDLGDGSGSVEFVKGLFKDTASKFAVRNSPNPRPRLPVVVSLSLEQCCSRPSAAARRSPCCGSMATSTTRTRMRSTRCTRPCPSAAT